MDISEILCYGCAAIRDRLKSANCFLYQIPLPVLGSEEGSQYERLIRHCTSATKSYQRDSNKPQDIDDFLATVKDCFKGSRSEEGLIYLLIYSPIDLSQYAQNLSDFDFPMILVGVMMTEFDQGRTKCSNRESGVSYGTRRAVKRPRIDIPYSSCFNLYVRWNWVYSAKDKRKFCNDDICSLFFAFCVVDTSEKAVDRYFHNCTSESILHVYFGPDQCALWTPSLAEWLRSWNNSPDTYRDCGTSGRLRTIQYVGANQYLERSHDSYPYNSVAAQKEGTEKNHSGNLRELRGSKKNCFLAYKTSALLTEKSMNCFFSWPLDCYTQRRSQVGWDELQDEFNKRIESICFQRILEYCLEQSSKKHLEVKLPQYLSNSLRMVVQKSCLTFPVPILSEGPCLELDFINCHLYPFKMVLSVLMHQPIYCADDLESVLKPVKLYQFVINHKVTRIQKQRKILFCGADKFRYRLTQHQGTSCATRRFVIPYEWNEELQKDLLSIRFFVSTTW